MLKGRTRTLTAVLTSSKVVANDSTSSCGMSVMNPTVSTNHADTPHGNRPLCTDESNVANNSFSPFIRLSLVRSFVRVVFPTAEMGYFTTILCFSMYAFKKHGLCSLKDFI